MARLCDTAARIVYFPVRHHSPTAARLLDRLIRESRPAAVLIEGPSDYNEHFAELLLDHQLPIAIYSYFQLADGTSSGAYYPFCDYSPEWIALRTASQLGAIVRFIDLPWRDTAPLDRVAQRYADAHLRHGRYVRTLCERLEVENFDDLWDKIVECDERLTLVEYMHRVHSLCTEMRRWEDETSAADRCREAFMADEVRKVAEQCAATRRTGPIVVVTGGYHSSALATQLADLDVVARAASRSSAAPRPDVDRQAAELRAVGIALTTYSYERLDNLQGYEAGLPNPGFYDAVWTQRRSGRDFDHAPLLAELVDELRQRKQTLSTADAIAIETMSRGLAALRGREAVWRRDLVDGVTSALLKDELQFGLRSPFLAAVHSVLRGRRRGRLAAGTRLPPLVLDIQRQLTDAGWELKRSPSTVQLDLLSPADRERSRLLHRLSVLEISGFRLLNGTDFLRRDDLARLWEEWELRWSPEFESKSIEASRYGATLSEATAERLRASLKEKPRSAASAAAFLVRAAQTGLETLSRSFLDETKTLLEQEGDFAAAAAALNDLLYLFCFDEVLATHGSSELAPLVESAFQRCLWLLELIGRSVPSERSLLTGVKTVFEAYQRAGSSLQVNQDEFVELLTRISGDRSKLPSLRGAATGVLWSVGRANEETVLRELRAFVDPNDVGDFLTGLFALAREVAQRHPQLVSTIDRLLLDFSPDGFQQALPALRLAFTFFTPREKHYLLSTLFESLGADKKDRPDSAAPDVASDSRSTSVASSKQADEATPHDIVVDVETAAEALLIDERLFAAIERFGLQEGEL
ncbi:MAG TPA: DUF5682 family protein [Pirellulaceae bacterium]|nr:DUF5682 family protein [Pirellulaceae bacterium]